MTADSAQEALDEFFGNATGDQLLDAIDAREVLFRLPGGKFMVCGEVEGEASDRVNKEAPEWLKSLVQVE